MVEIGMSVNDRQCTLKHAYPNERKGPAHKAAAGMQDLPASAAASASASVAGVLLEYKRLDRVMSVPELQARPDIICQDLNSATGILRVIPLVVVHSKAAGSADFGTNVRPSVHECTNPKTAD